MVGGLPFATAEADQTNQVNWEQAEVINIERTGKGILIV